MRRLEKIKFVAVFIFLALLSILNYSCSPKTSITQSLTGGGSNNGNGGSGTQPSVVTGQVTNSITGIPIDSALVQIIYSSINVGVYTNTLGKFLDTLHLSSNTTFTVYISKPGYVTDTLSITVNLGTPFSFGEISISPISSGGQKPSGNPVSLSLLSQSSTSIGVVGSGSIETATLVFVALDSSGTPIDLLHSVSVTFSFGAHPGGGEVFSPAVVQTNDQGQAAVNITSGTKAGTVQILATITIGTQKIFSMPIGIAIFGGFPDANHFSVAPAYLNFPGWEYFGLTDQITAYVGDKYGNPCRPKTAVYFTTTGGIIGGSANTDNMGEGPVDLLSAAPLPVDQTFGAGFARVTASTADENKNTITASTVVLFSGVPQLSISPTTFNIPNAGSQLFNYTVSDQNGNPLAGGTSINVTVKDQNLGVQGETSLTLPDTQSKTWTHFSFQAYDTTFNSNTSTVSITITVNGPNGNIEKTIYGTSH